MMGKSLCVQSVLCNLLLAALVLAAGVDSTAQQADVPRWGLFETSFTSERPAENPLQDVELRVTFEAPSKRSQTVRGFWDGETRWRVRFSPDEPGDWRFTTSATPAGDRGLHGQTGRFRVTSAVKAAKSASPRVAA